MIRVLTGDDPVAMSEAVTVAVDELLGDMDRSLALEVVTEKEQRTDDGDWSLAALVTAARTPPMLTDRRVVVGRHLARYTKKADVAPLLDLVADLDDTSHLVLVWERGTTSGGAPDAFAGAPKAVRDAVTAAGGLVVDVSPPERKAGDSWVRERLAASSLRFRRDAVDAVLAVVGEDRSRVVGIVRTLEGALGAGAEVTADDVAVYVGADAGEVAPWELDDAIDRGDVAGALAVLTRLVPRAGTESDRTGAAFRLVALQATRYGRMLRLDGSGARSAEEAAEVLGMRSAFPAKKLLGTTRRLGSDGVARAVTLLSEADLQLRGTVDWPPELVVEVLVARLARLSRTR